MATNWGLDPDLIDRALKVSGERTNKAVLTRALQQFIARRNQKRLIDPMGKLQWDDDLNYKGERARNAVRKARVTAPQLAQVRGKLRAMIAS
jgi:hypothetical protein